MGAMILPLVVVLVAGLLVLGMVCAERFPVRSWPSRIRSVVRNSQEVRLEEQDVEVEAALDDTNLGRLLEIFTELRRSSQLIIITHQKRTMEVADALYGITMRDGVTKAVSQRLAQPDRGTAVTPDV